MWVGGAAQAVTTTTDAIDDGNHIFVTFERDAATDRLTCFAHNSKTGSAPVVFILVSVTCQVNPDGAGSGWQDLFTAPAADCGPSSPASCTRAPTSGELSRTWNPCGDGHGASPDYRAQADGYWYNVSTNKHHFRDGGALSTPALTVTKSSFC
jgi:hypothetical protein